MIDAPAIGATIYLEPTDTVRAWEERNTLSPTVRWSEMMHEAHAQAFTVAKIAKLDLLSSVRASLDDVIRRGGTFEDWRANILPELKRQGWWGRVQDAELTGTTDPVIINESRLKTIYRTNIRMSIAAGRWRKYQVEKDVFPYLRYLSRHYRKHPRADHRSWHGLILPIDHPWWQTHFPPNGWGCNCDIEQVSERMLRREGWTVGEPPQDDQRGFKAADGRTYQVPEGVSPAFAYNPGTAHLATVAQRAFQSLEQAVRANPVQTASVLAELVADKGVTAFLTAPRVVQPVAVLPPPAAAVIGAERTIELVGQSAPAPVARIVGLSSEAATRLLAHHLDLALADFQRLTRVIGQATYRLRQDRRTLINLYQEPDGWWRAAVESTESGDSLYVTSLHRISADEVGRLRGLYPEVE